jgi:glycosyltransferase involved in cell wall biosynthesis
MFTIGIDGNEANIQNRVGVNKYALEMIRGLGKLTSREPQNYSLIVYLKNEPLSDMPKPGKNFKYIVLGGAGLWIITKLTPYLLKNPEKIDILFSPSHYTPPLLTIPRVCSIMDLGYLESSEHFEKNVFWQLKYWTAISVFVSKQVLTISEATKKDIVRHYPFASKKITVTHLGYDSDKFTTKVSENVVRQVKNKYSIVGDYVLFLSTLKPSKNVEGLIDAYALLSQKKLNRPLPLLVIAGKKGWMFEGIYKRVEQMGLTDKVVFTDYFPESERPALMAGSLLYVLPSFWEGFGIEVLSAFASGKPAVISNVGSLPEVGGDAAVYVDPEKPKSISEGIEKVLNMSRLDYNKLVQKGLLQAKKFSWGKCASQTLKVLESAVTK